MGNSLRCCLACVLPCGALDVIRIVHLNGYVEEITRSSVTAAEILRSHPNHALTTPSSQGVVRKILILSPESELRRGSIYFLIPAASLPEKKKTCRKTGKTPVNAACKIENSYLPADCDGYPTEILSKKKSTRREGRGRRTGIWRPHLESISEDM